jgi:speckle-type POZ protein
MPSSTPAAGGGKPSRSSSAIVADTSSGYHILRIDGYSRTKGLPTGERLVSRPFFVGGHRWCIRYYPNGVSSQYADYISLFLALDGTVTKEVKAQQQFRLVDEDIEVEEEVPSLTLAEVRSFEGASGSGWGNLNFIKRQELETSKHLRDDSFTVRCDIVVTNEFRTEGTANPATPAYVTVPSSNLHQHLGDLLLTEKGADVAFDVGGATFAAHRCVLATRSPVFCAELFGTMKEGGTAGVIQIDEMEAQVFKALLYFVYTDLFPEPGKGDEEEDVMSQHLLVAADRYNLERLKLMCEERLCKYINVGTVATILTLAELHHCPGLKKACFDFLSSPANLMAVAAGDGFKHLSRSCPSVMEELIVMLGKLVQ